MSLTQKRETFTLLYFETGSAKGAYESAFKIGRSSPATISNNAYKLLQNTEIITRLAELRLKSETDAVMTKQEALARLTCIGRFTVNDIATFGTYDIGYDEDGKPITATSWKFKNSEDMPKNAMSAIKSVTATASGPKFEMFDALAATKQISDILGWNAPIKTEVEANIKNDWHIHPTSAKTDE
jgi:phage terminase small subunit